MRRLARASDTAMPGSRRAIGGLVLTLIGLIALLTIPIVARQRAERLHGISENILEPARAQIDEAIRQAQDCRSYAYALYYATDKPTVAHQMDPERFYDRMLRDWHTATANVTLLSACGREPFGAWRKGKTVLDAWLNKTGRTYVVDQEPPAGETMEGANQIFDSGVELLRAAKEDILVKESAVHDEIAATGRFEIGMLVPMALICLSLACLSLYNLYSLRRSWERERETSSRLSMAVKETNHRIKNNLQIIGALIDMQQQEPGEMVPKQVLTEITQQVNAVAAVHDFLSHEMRSDRIQADSMLNKLVSLVKTTSHLEVLVEAEAIVLPVRQATAISLVVNELLSNSGKHGATSARVSMTSTGSMTELEVTDNGPGFPENFDPILNANLGLTLIATLARHDLGGDIAFESRDGAYVVLRFPPGA